MSSNGRSGLVPIHASRFDSKYHEQVFRYHLGPDRLGNHCLDTLWLPDEPFLVKKWKPLWDDLRMNCDANGVFFHRVRTGAVSRPWLPKKRCYSAGIRVRSTSSASTSRITLMLRDIGFPESLIDDLYALANKNKKTGSGAVKDETRRFSPREMDQWLRDYQTEVVLTWLYYTEHACANNCRNPVHCGAVRFDCSGREMDACTCKRS